MPLFVMIGHDGPDGARRRDARRAAHVSHVDGLDSAGRIVFAGPIRSADDSESIGAVIVFEAPDLSEAEALVARDPYVSGGVFESLTVARIKRVYPKD